MQRVPATEKQGRRHSSTVTLIEVSDADESAVAIDRLPSSHNWRQASAPLDVVLYVPCEASASRVDGRCEPTVVVQPMVQVISGGSTRAHRGAPRASDRRTRAVRIP